MALAIILRSSAKPQGVKNLFKISSVALNNAARYALLSGPNKTSLIQKCSKFAKPGHVSMAIPKRFSHGGDHSLMWTIEKAVSASLLLVMPAALMFPNVLFDSIMAVLLTAHSHWGVEAIVLDYVRPIIFGSFVPRVAFITVYVVSAATLGGLLYFNFSNIGISRAVRRLWAGQ